ncbi:MAG: hypothetical protein ACK559_13345 [bacterium]
MGPAGAGPEAGRAGRVPRVRAGGDRAAAHNPRVVGLRAGTAPQPPGHGVRWGEEAADGPAPSDPKVRRSHRVLRGVRRNP